MSTVLNTFFTQGSGFDNFMLSAPTGSAPSDDYPLSGAVRSVITHCTVLCRVSLPIAGGEAENRLVGAK